MNPLSNPWFWVVAVIMMSWAFYSFALPGYNSRPITTDGWFGALVGSPVHGRRTVVIAVVCNLAAAVLGLNAWRLAPSTPIHDLPLFHRFIIALWVANIGRVSWALHLVGQPARCPSMANVLAILCYIYLGLAVLLPLIL